MMVDGQPRNMPNCYSTSPRTSMNGIKSDCKSCGTDSKLMRDLTHSLTWREKGDVQKLQNIKHINGVSKNGKLRSRHVALDNAAIPCGPAPSGTSSMRAPPNVHAALRQNDPKMASFSQPAVKKAPPTSGPSYAISIPV